MLEVESKYEVLDPDRVRRYFAACPDAYPPRRLLADYYEDDRGVTASLRLSIRTRLEDDAVILTLKADRAPGESSDTTPQVARYEWPLAVTPADDEETATRVMARYRRAFGALLNRSLKDYETTLRDPESAAAYARVSAELRAIPEDAWQLIGGSDVCRYGVTLYDEAGEAWMFTYDEGRLFGGQRELPVREAEFEWQHPPEASSVRTLPVHPLPETLRTALRSGTLPSKHARIHACHRGLAGELMADEKTVRDTSDPEASDREGGVR